MKNRTILFVIGGLLFTIGVMASFIFTKSQNINSTKIGQQDTSMKLENINNNVIQISGELDRTIPTTEDLFNDEDTLIVIGKLISIDGGTNYNPTKQVYTTICSIGQMEITQVIKGSFNSNTIKILKLGGEISFKEYEEGLSEAQKSKDGVNKLFDLPEEEKEQKTVRLNYDDMIQPEIGKEYLFVLKYNSDYDRYIINSFAEGTREIKRELSLTSRSNSENILVKNNETNEWEDLENLKDIIK